VHLFGNPCDMTPLLKAARLYGLKIVEDATESLGAFYTKGKLKNRHTGTVGHVGIYSFNGNKIMTTGGGGMLVTNDKTLADQAKYLTTQAKDDGLFAVHNNIGYNYRLTNVQAAIGMAQLERLDEFIKTKKRNYQTYKEGLAKIAGTRLLGSPEGVSPNYWFYSLMIDESEFGLSRDRLMDELLKLRIETRPVWRLNHRQKPHERCQAYRIENARRYQDSVLNLPCSSNLKTPQALRVISAIKDIQRRKR